MKTLLVQSVVQHTGLVFEQAEQAVAVVLHYLGSKLPNPEHLNLVLEGINPRDQIQQVYEAIQAPFDHSDVVVVEQVLKKGIDPNFATAAGETFLHVAAYCNREEIVKSLISQGANVNAQDNEGRTPIYIATCSNRDLQVTKLLLDAGAEPDIFTACLLGDQERIASIIETHPEAVNASDSFRKDSPLHKAVETSDLGVVKLLLQNGADVMATNRYKDTPLHRAAQFDQPKVVELLLTNGADVNAKNRIGGTPLDKAVLKHGVRAEVVEILRNHQGRCDLEIRSIKWTTFMAELKRHYAELEFEVEFAFADDGSCLETYNVQPRGARYFIKKINERGGPGWQDSALEEIKHIFFPYEEVVVREITQWREMADDMDVNLLVERRKE